MNDTWGHGVGDEVLQVLSKTLSESLDSNAIVARYGGEEFVCLIKIENDAGRNCVVRI